MGKLANSPGGLLSQIRSPNRALFNSYLLIYCFKEDGRRVVGGLTPMTFSVPTSQ